MHDRPTSLLELPLDLLVLIFSYSTPGVIISVRLTCKTLSGSTEARIVWLDALKRVCLSHGIPFVTYDFDRMPREELEYAASAPDRFLHIGHRAMLSPSHTLLPLKSRRIPIRLPDCGPSGGWEDDELERVKLLPGGRFVLGRTEDLLLLWDLASGERPCLAVHGTIDGVPGLNLAWADAAVDLEDIVHYPATSKIRLVVNAYESGSEYDVNGNKAACIVYELNLSESPPTMDMLGYLKGAGCASFGASGSRVLFESHDIPRIVGAWDYERGTVACWIIDGEGMHPDMTAVTDYHVVYGIRHKHCVIAYNLPPLSPSSGIIPATIDVGAPIQRLYLRPDDYGDYPMRCTYASYIHGRPADALIVDSAVSCASNDSGLLTQTVTRFCVALDPSDTPLSIEGTMVQHNILRIAAPKQSADKVTVAYHLNDLGRREIMVHSASICGGTQGRAIFIGRKRSTLFSDIREWLEGGGEYDFCAASGRLCVGRSDKNALFIYDFIPSYP